MTTSAAALNARLFLTPTSPSNMYRPGKEMSKTYAKLEKCLEQVYAIVNVIARTDDAQTCDTQPPAVSQNQCAEGLPNVLRQCKELYHEYVLTYIYIKGPHKSYCHGFPSYRSKTPVPTLFNLTWHAAAPEPVLDQTDLKFEKGFDRCLIFEEPPPQKIIFQVQSTSQ